MRPKKQKTPVKMLPAPSLAHSGLKVGAVAFWLRFKRFATPSHLLFAAASVYLVLTIAFTASFFIPRSVSFSFAGKNCFVSPTLLPNLIAKTPGKTYSAAPHASVAIAGYPLYSHTTCVEPSQAPAANIADHISLHPLGLGFLKKDIRVATGELPKVDSQTPLKSPVSTKDPLVFPLDTPDAIFGYQLAVNDKLLGCTVSGASVVCEVGRLNLEQSAGYTFKLQRLFDGQVSDTLFEQHVATVGAVELAGSSIKPSSTVYTVPDKITLKMSKAVHSMDGVQLDQIDGKDRKAVSITSDFAGQTITIHLPKPLARQAKFELSIASVSSPDGGHLPETLVLPFATSGGPKVKWANIGSYKVLPTNNIVLTFDSKVSGNQKLGNFIKLEIDGKSVSAAVTASGKQVTLNPTNGLPRCTHLTIRVLDGLKNEAGVTGGSAWSYSSRTICQQVFSIGSSVQGRGITAYRFGSGGSYIVFVGGTHGNEKSSVYTLNALVDYLERNYSRIPSRRSIIVIPNLNPDAFALSKRTNWHDVDLNRNFPANNWKKNVTMPGGTYNPGGGGSAPLSEPESKAIANYILKVDPRLVLTYHAAAGVVMPNDAGDSNALAKKYDQKSNLYYEPSSQTGEIFQYDTTGSMEEWLYDKHGIPALLVELWTLSGNEFYKNVDAMMHMITLP